MSPTPNARPYRADPQFLAGATLLAALVVLLFSCPVVSRWRFLDTRCRASFPEVHRAHDTLKQLGDPWQRITNASNEVLNWRLLFPVLGHYLHLPPWLFLALPPLGCLLVVAFVIHRVALETDRLYALLAGTLLATTSWFFVSMGWLAYFDSWLALGLLIAAFAESRLLLAAAALLIPWVDERFILALPLTLVIRTVAMLLRSERLTRGLWVDAAVCAAGIAPHLAARCWFLFSQEDDTTRSYLSAVGLHAGPLVYLEGVWSGFRLIWLLFPLLLVEAARRLNWMWSVLLGGLLAVTLALNLLLAGDLSRDTTPLFPACVLGVLVLYRWFSPRTAQIVAGTLLGANLLLPAVHVVTAFRSPIHPYWTEMNRWLFPSPKMQSEWHVWRFNCMIESNEITTALEEIGRAIDADPTYAKAYVLRGTLRLRQGWMEPARDDYDRALKLDPRSLEVLLARGALLETLGDTAAAREDYRRALEYAPADWSMRTKLSERLKVIDKGTKPP